MLCFSSLAYQASAKTKILLLGDSLSAAYGMQEEEGWVALLKRQLADEKPDLELINASISGETTGGGLQRLDHLLLQHSPNWLWIELGGNDGLRGYPVAKIRQNLDALVKKAQKRGINVLINQIQIPPNYGRKYTSKFTQVFPSIAAENNVSLLPFFMLPLVEKPEMLLADKIHPSKQAQPLIAAWIKPKLLAELAQN